MELRPGVSVFRPEVCIYVCHLPSGPTLLSCLFSVPRLLIALLALSRDGSPRLDGVALPAQGRADSGQSQGTHFGFGYLKGHIVGIGEDRDGQAQTLRH